MPIPKHSFGFVYKGFGDASLGYFTTLLLDKVHKWIYKVSQAFVTLRISQGILRASLAW